VLAVQTIRVPDAVLVRAARDGNRAAFGDLYQRYWRMVHGILLAYVSSSDAEDLAQEAFVHAIERLHGLRQDNTFGAWLASIARRLALDHRRRARRNVELTDDCAGGSLTDEGAFVLRAIRNLPEAYRETIMLRFVEGMTGPEIAAQTGMQPESVRVNLCRGMKILRGKLGGKP
jgi:RNA polymerase sigma-70 factor (ECF subfamily)